MYCIAVQLASCRTHTHPQTHTQMNGSAKCVEFKSKLNQSGKNIGEIAIQQRFLPLPEYSNIVIKYHTSGWGSVYRHGNHSVAIYVPT